MKIYDNGGRREMIDRRQVVLPLDFPERRSNQERRIETDRRSGLDRRSPKGFRVIAGMDRRAWFRWNSPLF